jgi:hypothetical protein
MTGRRPISKSTISENGNTKEVLVRTGNKNLIVDTREIFLLIDGQPFMMPCSGTKHGFARAWNSHLLQLRDETGALLPSYACQFRLTTLSTENASGKWFAPKFENLGAEQVTEAEYDAAERLADIVERGAMRVETPHTSE